MVSFNLDKLKEQLENLKQLPNIKEVVALRKRLAKELEKAILKIKKEVVAPAPVNVKALANEKRSTKLQRYWRYVKLIRNNFPEFSVSKIRKQLTQRQQGQEVNIPDAVWQNPSP